MFICDIVRECTSTLKVLISCTNLVQSRSDILAQTHTAPLEPVIRLISEIKKSGLILNRQNITDMI